MATQEVVRPVVSTSTASKLQEQGITDAKVYVNNLPETLGEVDKELHLGYVLQTVYQNETDYRLFALLQSQINYNKATARANVADYERSVDAFAKLPQYRKSHTRDAAEQLFCTTDIGKIKLGVKKVSEQYLAEHK